MSAPIINRLYLFKILEMRLFLLLAVFSVNLYAQSQKEVADFHNHIMDPYNDVAIKMTKYTASALKQSPNNVLVANRDALVVAIKKLNKALETAKPIEKDFTLLAEVKKSAGEFDKYVKLNLMSNELSMVPTDARGNIKLIHKYQKVNKKFEILGERVIIRQKKLFAHYKFKSEPNPANKNIIIQRESMVHYYTINVSQFKVQAHVDDFIDAYNSGNLATMKLAKSKGTTQVNKALLELGNEKPFQGDTSIIGDSKKILSFYNTLFTEKFAPMIKVSSYPEEVPESKIDDYNKAVEDANKSMDFYSSLQSVLDESTTVSGLFFKRYLD